MKLASLYRSVLRIRTPTNLRGRSGRVYHRRGRTARPPAARSPLPAHAPAITASGARPGRPQRLLVVWRACWRTAAQARSVNGRGGAGAWRPSARRRRTRQAPELAGVTAGLGAWSAWSRARAATRGRGLCAHPPRWTVRRGRSRASVRAPARAPRCARPGRPAPDGVRSNCRSREPHFTYRHTRTKPARASRRRGGVRPAAARASIEPRSRLGSWVG